MSYNQRQKEIETIKEREISLNLSDADCKKLSILCGKYDITISKLLENFIGDLICGTYCNGSDENSYAEDWFFRTWFGMFPEEEKTLLKFLLEREEVEEFLKTIEFIEEAKEEIKDYENNPENYDAEYIEDIEFLKRDIELSLQCYEYYINEFKQINSKVNIKDEIEKVKRWVDKTKALVIEGIVINE